MSCDQKWPVSEEPITSQDSIDSIMSCRDLQLELQLQFHDSSSNPLLPLLPHTYNSLGAMAHSKRNTSLPHFTSYERTLLRTSWGTQRGVIGRDSFLPFASCRLCLQPTRAPVVACATNGDLFCRECAISDLLTQRTDIKRVEKERGDAKRRLVEEDERVKREAREREVREFELTSMGLEGENHKKRKVGDTGEGIAHDREVEVGGKRKKMFELDEKELTRVVRDEEERMKEELKKEKVSFFFVPGLCLSIHHANRFKVRIDQIRSALLLGPITNSWDRSG